MARATRLTARAVCGPQLPVLVVLLAGAGAVASLERSIAAQLRATAGAARAAAPAPPQGTCASGGGGMGSGAAGGTQSWCGRREMEGSSSNEHFTKRSKRGG